MSSTDRVLLVLSSEKHDYSVICANVYINKVIDKKVEIKQRHIYRGILGNNQAPPSAWQ